jgi:hypothetical protein
VSASGGTGSRGTDMWFTVYSSLNLYCAQHHPTPSHRQCRSSQASAHPATPLFCLPRCLIGWDGWVKGAVRVWICLCLTTPPSYDCLACSKGEIRPRFEGPAARSCDGCRLTLCRATACIYTRHTSSRTTHVLRSSRPEARLCVRVVQRRGRHDETNGAA